MGMLFVAPATAYHHHHHHHHGGGGGGNDQLLSSSSEHPMIPLLTAADIMAKPAGSSAGIHLWQPQPQLPSPIISSSASANPATTTPYLRKPLPMLDAAAGIFTGVSGCSTPTCQDCGNQAKKDCSHRRCRTCCKSRGFDCSTHIKSTWVPAARRRERQLTAVTGIGGAGSSTSTSAMKKPRLISSQTTNTTTSHTSTSNTTPPRSFDTSSSHQDEASLPGQVRAPAVFKCVRVTSIDDGQDQYAYEAMVKIGGHVFKGFLYDQGLDDRPGDADINSGSNSTIPNISELQLGGVGGDGGDVFGGGGASGLVGGGARSFGNTVN